MVFNFHTLSIPGSNSAEEPTIVPRRFSVQELQVATVNFWHKNILEIGVTGTIYRGCLPSGALIAVKRLRQKEQFLTEKEAGNSGLHPDASPVIGYCISGEEHILIYPLAIRDRQNRICCLGHIFRALAWQTRKQPPVCLGSYSDLCSAIPGLESPPRINLWDDLSDPGMIIRHDLDASGELLERDFKGQTPAVPQVISWRDRLRSSLPITNLSDQTGLHLIQCSPGAFTLILIFCIGFVLGFAIF